MAAESEYGITMHHKLCCAIPAPHHEAEMARRSPALGESSEPRIHDALCRPHVYTAFEAAVKSGEDLLVACTQEACAVFGAA